MRFSAKGRRLAIFDVDGTLCDTCGVDDECFRAVASELLQVPLDPSSWEGSPHITDSGILDWWWWQFRQRAPTTRELVEFAAAFEAVLTQACGSDPQRFAAIPGAAQFLELIRQAGWDVAIATGGWSRTARFKLSAAGLPAELLVATADDSHDRIEIVRLAECRAAVAYETTFARTVYVGDGVWDVTVAARLGWPLLGVGRADRAERLRLAGATAVVADFSDGSTALRLLEQCTVPEEGSR